MLLFLRITFSVITIALAGYGILTKDFQFQAHVFLFLGQSFLIYGIQEIQQKRKMMGWILLVVSAFVLFTSIQGFLLL